MDGKFIGAISLAAALAFLAVNPVGAHGNCGGGGEQGNGFGNGFGNRGGRGNHYGWRNQNGNQNNWHNQSRFGAFGGGYNRYNNANNANGYGAFGTNSVAAYPYWGQQNNLSSKVSRLQQRLASGNLSPDKAARLQSELARLQGQQTGLNGYWNNRLSSEQTYLQQLLSSGTLNASQAARVQDRLARIQNVESGVGANGLYGNQSTLGNLRNILGF